MEDVTKDILKRRGALHVIDGHRFYTEQSVFDAINEALRKLSVSGWKSYKDNPPPAKIIDLLLLFESGEIKSVRWKYEYYVIEAKREKVVKWIECDSFR